MIIRPIDRKELDLFTAFTDQPERNERFRAYLTQMWDEGYIRPEWCFVAEVAGAFIGRVVYWTLPSLDNLFEVDFLEVPWEADYLEVGTNLLRSSLALLQEHAVIQYVIDTPPPMSTFAERRLEVMEQFGFVFTRETRRFEWLQTEIIPSQRLVFRSLDDVGETVFINAMMRVSEHTLDRLLQQEIETLGLAQSAIEQFQLLQAFKYKSTWWQLAYNQIGDLVGLIMPAENDGGAIIGYIGVVPEHRGNGYVNDLLAQGTVTLKADGARRVRADTDVDNAPIVSAFEKAGYHQFASRREYRLNYTTG